MIPYYSQDGIDIYHGDCRDVLPRLDGDSIDFVFTDPPYKRQFDHVWDAIADHVPRVMKSGASLMSYCGQYQLPRVLSAIGRSLRYHWLCFQPNSAGINPILHGFKVKTNYKPVLWFVKDRFTRDVILDDNLGRLGRDWAKRLHKWAQPIAPQPFLKLTEEGGLILDPFVGSGTMLLAAQTLGRRAIGIEIEERFCEIAANRIRQRFLFGVNAA